MRDRSSKSELNWIAVRPSVAKSANTFFALPSLIIIEQFQCVPRRRGQKKRIIRFGMEKMCYVLSPFCQWNKLDTFEWDPYRIFKMEIKLKTHITIEHTHRTRYIVQFYTVHTVTVYCIMIKHSTSLNFPNKISQYRWEKKRTTTYIETRTFIRQQRKKKKMEEKEIDKK